jgi:hypothetical protein
MRTSRPIAIGLTGLLLTLPACSSKRPTLYPNDQYQKAGQAQAERDIEDCEDQADEYVKSGGQAGPRAKEAATNVGVGTAVGAASGAVGGAIWGNAGQGAAAGAAGGATAGLIGTLFGWMLRPAPEPDPAYRSYVERCLRDKGYDPIGWT